MPPSAELQNNLGVCYALMKDLSQAEELWTSVEELPETEQNFKRVSKG